MLHSRTDPSCPSGLQGRLRSHGRRLGRGVEGVGGMLAGLAVLVLALAGVLEHRACGQHIHSVAGPFRIVPDHIEHCPPEIFKKELAIWSFRGTRDRHNIDVWYYSGNYTLAFNFTDDLNVELNVASWSSRGGWKGNAHVLKFRHICSTGKNFVPQVWQQIMNSVSDANNVTRPDCPFPPGQYFLNHCKADLSVAKKVPVFFYGKWRADFQILDPDWKCISCMRIFANTVPRLPARNNKE